MTLTADAAQCSSGRPRAPALKWMFSDPTTHPNSVSDKVTPPFRAEAPSDAIHGWASLIDAQSDLDPVHFRVRFKLFVFNPQAVSGTYYPAGGGHWSRLCLGHVL